jgi:hypothetical protein
MIAPLVLFSTGTDLATSTCDETDARQFFRPSRQTTARPRLMSLYISASSDSGISIVRLEGWLEGEAVAELERVVSGDSGPLRLDLSELRSADTAGVAALRALRAAGASIVGASPYIKLLLGN